ncbi:MAG: hypothetical protein B9S33_11120 [Pedosphaera sp. Tous-C6FEB]|nr:MAG: hypothetical protein B9S33_11120 [Pedosphaera sp. Tous-C6FEB]
MNAEPASQPVGSTEANVSLGRVSQLVLAAWWLAASGLSGKARFEITGAALMVLLLGFLVPFLRHNFWL